jgi:hypothetical protein
VKLVMNYHFRRRQIIETLVMGGDQFGVLPVLQTQSAETYRWLFSPEATLVLNSADLFRGTVRDFH